MKWKTFCLVLSLLQKIPSEIIDHILCTRYPFNTLIILLCLVLCFVKHVPVVSFNPCIVSRASVLTVAKRFTLKLWAG